MRPKLRSKLTIINQQKHQENQYLLHFSTIHQVNLQQKNSHKSCQVKLHPHHQPKVNIRKLSLDIELLTSSVVSIRGAKDKTYVSVFLEFFPKVLHLKNNLSNKTDLTTWVTLKFNIFSLSSLVTIRLARHFQRCFLNFLEQSRKFQKFLY